MGRLRRPRPWRRD
ncbi:unnamed protein product [Timema podura]|uniref:Uncharacterized protein n=1 Tax=Timema podura TaxID=61482 RepID=A0ABN7PHS3_TIMPD|nr:unnamed protein product [Timema podura]